MARLRSRKTPISSSSTPATFAKRRPIRSTRSWASCALLKRERAQAGRDFKIVVAGCVAQAEGAKSCAGKRRSISSSARRAITVCRSCCNRPARGERLTDTDFAVEEKFRRLPNPRARKSARAACRLSSRCRKAATSSVRSASCPIRAAPKSRAASPKLSPRRSASSTRACARSR